MYNTPYYNIHGDSVARGPKLFTDNSLGPLATESPCINHVHLVAMTAEEMPELFKYNNILV